MTSRPWVIPVVAIFYVLVTTVLFENSSQRSKTYLTNVEELLSNGYWEL